MKKMQTILIGIILMLAVNFATALDNVSYTNFARTSGGQLITDGTNQYILVSIDHLGTKVYEEKHQVIPNSFGLFSVKVGTGTPVTPYNAATYAGLPGGGQDVSKYQLKVEISSTDADYYFLAQTMMTNTALVDQQAAGTVTLNDAYSNGDSIEVEAGRIVTFSGTGLAQAIISNVDIDAANDYTLVTKGYLTAATDALAAEPYLTYQAAGLLTNEKVLNGEAGVLSFNATTATVSVDNGGIGTLKIADDAVTEPKLAMTNAASNGYVIKWNTTTGGLTWSDPTVNTAHPVVGDGTAANKITLYTPIVGSTDNVLFWNGTTWTNSLVTTPMITDANVTGPKLDAAIAGLGLSQNLSGNLDVNVDGSTLEINADILRVKMNGITPNELDQTTVTLGNYGNATNVGTFTVDADGRLTAAADVKILATSAMASDATFLANDVDAIDVQLNEDVVGPFELAPTTVTLGNYGNATNVGTFTVDAEGRLTAAADVKILATSAMASDATFLANDVDAIDVQLNEDVVGPFELMPTTVTLGNYGNATNVGTFTVDAEGRLTAAADVKILATSAMASDATFLANDVDAIDVQLNADVVTTIELADDAVETANILDANVTGPKLAAAVAGEALVQNLSGNLDVNHNATLEIVTDELGINLSNSNTWLVDQTMNADFYANGNVTLGTDNADLLTVNGVTTFNEMVMIIDPNLTANSDTDLLVAGTTTLANSIGQIALDVNGGIVQITDDVNVLAGNINVTSGKYIGKLDKKVNDGAGISTFEFDNTNDVTFDVNVAAPIAINLTDEVSLDYNATLTLDGNDLSINLDNANTWTATQTYDLLAGGYAIDVADDVMIGGKLDVTGNITSDDMVKAKTFHTTNDYFVIGESLATGYVNVWDNGVAVLEMGRGAGAGTNYGIQLNENVTGQTRAGIGHNGMSWVAGVGDMATANGAMLNWATNGPDEQRIIVANGNLAAPAFSVDSEGDVYTSGSTNLEGAVTFGDVAAGTDYTFPTADALVNKQVLFSDAAGTLTWGNPADLISTFTSLVAFNPTGGAGSAITAINNDGFNATVNLTNIGGGPALQVNGTSNLTTALEIAVGNLNLGDGSIVAQTSKAGSATLIISNDIVGASNGGALWIPEGHVQFSFGELAITADVDLSTDAGLQYKTVIKLTPDAAYNVTGLPNALEAGAVCYIINTSATDALTITAGNFFGTAAIAPNGTATIVFDGTNWFRVN